MTSTTCSTPVCVLAGPLGHFPANAWWAPRLLAGTAFCAFGASWLGLRREQRAWE